MITAPININQLSREDLRKRKNELEWTNVCAWRKFTLDLLRLFKDYVIWPLIAQQNDLSLSFIRLFIDYIDINDVVHYRELNLDFIRLMYLHLRLQLLNVIVYGNLQFGSKKRNLLVSEYAKTL